MANKHPDKPRPQLAVKRNVAKQHIEAQIEKAKSIPNASINENDEANRWYEFTAALLRQLFTTDELFDEFTGRGGTYFGDDTSTSHYLRLLVSIYERLELFPENPAATPNSLSVDPVAIIENLIKRFHSVVHQLRQRHDNRPAFVISDEYDVQDLFHALLNLHFDDIRPEEWTPSYAGGSSRMDFLLKAEKVVIEVKKTRARLGAKEIGEQLAVDILRYQSHQDCKTMVCFVYDPDECIANPRGLERDLSQPGGSIKVKVYVVQR